LCVLQKFVEQRGVYNDFLSLILNIRMIIKTIVPISTSSPEIKRPISVLSKQRFILKLYGVNIFLFTQIFRISPSSLQISSNPHRKQLKPSRMTQKGLKKQDGKVY
jgi:hypothetical protein